LVWTLRGRENGPFPFKRDIAYNNLPCTTVQACDVTPVFKCLRGISSS
jgi:hypothetical protein